jgi:hypothetical protein
MVSHTRGPSPHRESASDAKVHKVCSSGRMIEIVPLNK